MALHFLAYCDQDSVDSLLDENMSLEERQALFLFHARTAIKEKKPNTAITIDHKGGWVYFDRFGAEANTEKRQTLRFMALGRDLEEDFATLENENLDLLKLHVSQKQALKSQVRARTKEVEFLKERDKRALDVHLEFCGVAVEQEQTLQILRKRLKALEGENAELMMMMEKQTDPSA